MAGHPAGHAHIGEIHLEINQLLADGFAGIDDLLSVIIVAQPMAQVVDLSPHGLDLVDEVDHRVGHVAQFHHHCELLRDICLRSGGVGIFQDGQRLSLFPAANRQPNNVLARWRQWCDTTRFSGGTPAVVPDLDV